MKKWFLSIWTEAQPDGCSWMPELCEVSEVEAIDYEGYSCSSYDTYEECLAERDWFLSSVLEFDWNEETQQWVDGDDEDDE